MTFRWDSYSNIAVVQDLVGKYIKSLQAGVKRGYPSEKVTQIQKKYTTVVSSCLQEAAPMAARFSDSRNGQVFFLVANNHDVRSHSKENLAMAGWKNDHLKMYFWLNIRVFPASHKLRGWPTGNLDFAIHATQGGPR